MAAISLSFRDAMYELFDHTADLGLRAVAPTKELLFAELAAALTASWVEDPSAVLPQTQEEFALVGDDLPNLAVDWLRELLFRHETRQMLFAAFDVRFTSNGLNATILGEPFDADRHQLSHEVKAITYHGLRVEEVDGQWLAEVIVDI